MFWKDSISKKSHWNMILLLSSRKMAFVSAENMVFILRTKNERWSFSKNAWKYDVFCIFGKDDLSFPYKYDFLNIQKASWKYDVFCIFGKDSIPFFYKYEITLLLKKAKMIFSRKINLKMTFPAFLKKVILILEKMILTFYVNNLESVPMILCIFMETFLSVFIYCFPMKKSRKLKILDWNLTLSVSYMIGEILEWKIFETLSDPALRSCI